MHFPLSFLPFFPTNIPYSSFTVYNLFHYIFIYIHLRIFIKKSTYIVSIKQYQINESFYCYLLFKSTKFAYLQIKQKPNSTTKWVITSLFEWIQQHSQSPPTNDTTQHVLNAHTLALLQKNTEKCIKNLFVMSPMTSSMTWQIEWQQRWLRLFGLKWKMRYANKKLFIFNLFFFILFLFYWYKKKKIWINNFSRKWENIQTHVGELLNEWIKENRNKE